MFKKMKFALCAVAALGLLAGCQSEPLGSDDDFTQNEEGEWGGFEMYVIGSHWNADENGNWNTSTIKENEDCDFTKDDSGYLTIDIVVTDEMVKGWVGFKFIADNSWAQQYGVEDIDFEATDDAVLSQWTKEDGTVKAKTDFTGPTSNRTNIEIKVAGTYHVVFDPANFESETTDVTTYTNKFTITKTA